jgi:hypothetical protein
MDLRLKVFYGVSKILNEGSREEEVECWIAVSPANRCSTMTSWAADYG